jgi:hypothetical protein
LNKYPALARAQAIPGYVLDKLYHRLRSPSEPAAILKSITGLPNLVTLNAVRVFATLGIADVINGGTSDVEEIARKVGADFDGLSRVLRHLVGVGLLRYSGKGQVELTHVGALLIKGHPSLSCEMFQMDGIGRRFDATIAELMHSTMTGEPAYARANGEPLWNQLASDAQLARTFDIDMAQHIGSIGLTLAHSYDWSAISHVIDLGGGTGALLSHLLLEHRHLRGTIVEYADAATRARETLENSVLGSRLTVEEGSFFDELPKGADVYVLSWILHDWPDREAIEILKRARQAAGEKGQVFIIERPLDPKNLRTSTEDDLRVMVFVGGRERTLGEYSKVLAAADLQLHSTLQLRGRFTLMIARGIPSSEQMPGPLKNVV